MTDPVLLKTLAELVDSRTAAADGRLITIGICGAQGCGKTTLVTALAAQLTRAGRRVATLSLDDLYLTRARREELARDVHPLFVTRGVPGTHDVALGLASITALAAGEPAPLPRFDKAADDRVAENEWPLARADTQVLLLEGWCLGAQAQNAASLADPINDLEATEDLQGTWRSHVNAALDGPYQLLFAAIDALVLLAAPGWQAIAIWREQQEAALRSAAQPNAPGVMNQAQVARFIQHFERLTRHILEEMPARADLIVQLGAAREVRKISCT